MKERALLALRSSWRLRTVVCGISRWLWQLCQPHEWTIGCSPRGKLFAPRDTVSTCRPLATLHHGAMILYLIYNVYSLALNSANSTATYVRSQLSSIRHRAAFGSWEISKHFGMMLTGHCNQQNQLQNPQQYKKPATNQTAKKTLGPRGTRSRRRKVSQATQVCSSVLSKNDQKVPRMLLWVTNILLQVADSNGESTNNEDHMSQLPEGLPSEVRSAGCGLT